MAKWTEDTTKLVGVVFGTRWDAELLALPDLIHKADSEAVRTGSRGGSNFILVIWRARTSTVRRTIQETLEELLRIYRETGRRDPTEFWSVVEPELFERATKAQESMFATCLSEYRMDIQQSMLQRLQSQELPAIQQLVRSRVQELKTRSEFVLMKTPGDRIAHGVPDVAVMMWFPDKASDRSAAALAGQRYDAIANAVRDATKGQATIGKIDNQDIVVQDRISQSVEQWIEKSVVVICDLGGNRHNVYYEFGYARAAGTDLLLTCPTEDVDKITFHLRQWPFISYGSPDELAELLAPKLRPLLSRHDLSNTSLK